MGADMSSGPIWMSNAPPFVDASSAWPCLPDDLWYAILQGNFAKLPIIPELSEQEGLLSLRTVCKSWNKLICKFPKFNTKGIQDHSRIPTIFTSLRSFNIIVTSTDAPKVNPLVLNLKFNLQLLTGLQSLKFDTTKWTGLPFWSNNMREFSCLTNLTRLSLSIKHVTSLGPLTNLQCLFLGGTNSLNRDVLKQLPNLKTLGAYEVYWQADWSYTGYGVVKDPDGCRYRGGWLDGKAHGQGCWKDELGCITGEFSKNKLCGNAEKIHYEKDGSTSTHVGVFFQNRGHGPGIKTWSSGERCEATWVNGDRQGPGAFFWASGSYWEGNYTDDRREGKGIEYYFDPTTKTHQVQYEGMYLKNKINGHGAWYFQDGGRYEGEFVNGKKHGAGTLFFRQGVRYEGPFEQDDRCGFGVLYYDVSGVRVEGMYTKDARNGPGVVYFPDGDRFECSFKDHKPDGNGILFCADGTQQEMSFEDVEKMKNWDHAKAK